jgi:hypothetical protein
LETLLSSLLLESIVGFLLLLYSALLDGFALIVGGWREGCRSLSDCLTGAHVGWERPLRYSNLTERQQGRVNVEAVDVFGQPENNQNASVRTTCGKSITSYSPAMHIMGHKDANLTDAELSLSTDMH